MQNNIIIYLGYPNLIEKRYNIKTNKYYYVAIPVFLYQIEHSTGDVKLSPIPNINMEVIKKYTDKDIDSQMCEFIDLENELYLNSLNLNVNLEHLINKLVDIRKWEWREEMKPNSIQIDTPISTITKDGIYNRSIILTTEKSPYTKGLEKELMELSLMTENDYKNTALYDWVHKKISKTNIYQQNTHDVISVLPLNTEQIKAVNTSLFSNLTVITGPPGTGKSQVVANILINMAYNNKNVIFTSKNNKAVDVVESRVNNLGKRPIVLRVGNEQYRQHLIELLNILLSILPDNNSKKEYEDILKTYQLHINTVKTLKKQKEEIIIIRNTIDKLEQEYCRIREQFNSIFETLTNQDIDELYEYVKRLTKCYYRSIKKNQNKLIQIFWNLLKKRRQKAYFYYLDKLNTKLKQLNQKPITNHSSIQLMKEELLNINHIINSLELIMEYKNKLNILKNTQNLEQIDEYILKEDNLLSQITLEMWNKWLVLTSTFSSQERAKMLNYITALKLINDNDLNTTPQLKNQFIELENIFFKFLPCWAVTSLSAKGKIPFKRGIFDLLVVDEASQCDIASILPLLYRSKRVVVIGDPKQLTHITPISRQQDLNLMQKYNIDLEWSYSVNSLYTTATILSSLENTICLQDHHRSHADIIQFSNKEFYDNKLRIVTDYSRLKYHENIECGIQWKHIVGNTIRPQHGSVYNSEEIMAVIDELKRLVNIKYTGSIGVTTPFREQAERIRKSIISNALLYETLSTNNNLLINTIHTFQGNEKDVIIFSPVISKNTSQNTINFLNNTGNLFNVAITRACSTLKIIGDMEFCSHCSITYMENLVKYVNNLTKQNSNEQIHQNYITTKSYPDIPNKDQVSVWEIYLYEVLYSIGIKTIPQFPVDKYKLDLAIIIGDKKLDIEVDGEMYHKDWYGELCYRDQLRNHQLIKLGWDIKRFWVYQIRDDLPYCILEIKNWIEKNS